MALLNASTRGDFLIRINGCRRYVELVLRGHWDLATVGRFETTLRARLGPELERGGCRIGEQDTLFDLKDFPVQSQDVLAVLGRMALDPSIGSRRIAMILDSALTRQQARRVAPDYGVFDDRAAALAWLFASDGAAPATDPLAADL